MQIEAIQAELRARGLEGWLFYDQHHRDPIAQRVLGLPPEGLATRRWYYLIPARGQAVKLVHRIEAGGLDALPGERWLYAGWRELEEALRRLLARLGAQPAVAMQYSPGGALPAISLVDAGTMECLRSLGARIVSSGDLITRFDAVWTPAMLASHHAAGRVIDAAIAAAFAQVRRALDAGAPMTELSLQAAIVAHLQQAGLRVDEPPIVAVNAHTADPHYEPSARTDAAITPGGLVLLDVWAKLDQPDSAYYDVTWMGYCLRPGETAPPPLFEQAFAVARQARETGIALVQEATAAGRRLRGCDLDRAVRAVVAAAGWETHFTHRTGHSLGVEVHASGPNLDDFETRDEREILPGCAFTIEPGIYFSDFGVRTEINMHLGVHAQGARAEVTGPRQAEIVRI